MATPSRARLGRRGGIGPLIGEVSRLWRQRLDERLRPLGLSQAKWMALYRLARLPAAPAQGALATLLGVEGPTVARLLDGLEAAGYVARRASPADRRVKMVHLTGRARAKAAEIDRIAARLRRELMAGIDATQLDAATCVLADLRDRLAAPASRPATARAHPRRA